MPFAHFFRALILAASFVALPLTAAPFAYVGNEGSATISVIDTATDKVVKTLRFGQKPRSLAVSPDGTRLFVSDQTGNALVVVDLTKDAQIGKLALGDSPEAIYLSPDGKRLTAAIEENDQVLVIDVGALKVERTLKMKGKNPEHAVWSPDGKWIYASAEEADTVDIFDVDTGTLVKSVKVGNRPRGISFLPDGSRAYVAAENADLVNVFDTKTHDVIARIKAGKRSNGVLVHPDGKRVFVTSGGEGTVQVIDTATNAIVSTIPVGRRPWNMALTPDGKKLYVACGRSNAVAVIDTTTQPEDRGHSGRRTALGRRDPLTALAVSRRRRWISVAAGKQARALRDSDELHRRLSAEFLPDARLVIGDGLVVEAEFCGDRPDRVARGQQPRDLELARGQRLDAAHGARNTGERECPRNVGTEKHLSARNGTNGLDQRLGRTCLRDVAGRPGLEGTIRIYRLLVDAEHENPRRGFTLQEAANALDSTHVGERDVHDHYVGRKFAEPRGRPRRPTPPRQPPGRPANARAAGDNPRERRRGRPREEPRRVLARSRGLRETRWQTRDEAETTRRRRPGCAPRRARARRSREEFPGWFGNAAQSAGLRQWDPSRVASKSPCPQGPHYKAMRGRARMPLCKAAIGRLCAGRCRRAAICQN